MASILAGTVLVLSAGLPAEAGNETDRSSQWVEAAKRQAGDVQRGQRAARLRWEYERRRSGAHARMPSTLYASTPDRAAAELSCPVPGDRDARRIWRGHLDRRDRLELWDAGSARSRQPRSSAINVLSASRDGGAPARFSRGAAKGALSGHGGPAGGRTTPGDASATAEHVYLFPSASEPLRQGLVRVINHSSEAGDVRIEPVDDSGRGFDPVTLSMDAHATVHFNSGDLENGNPGKGLTGHTGPGQGNWRLAFTSDVDIEVLAYVGTPDGFLAAMHDVAPADGNVRRVAIFNPGSERSQASQLRLVNPMDAAAEVVIRGTDDRGVRGAGEVVLTLDAGTAREVTAVELESGAAGLGDGYGKWRLEVVSEQPIVAMSLLESPTGHLTNLSTVPPLPKDGRHSVPLFPAASDPSGRQGFLRLVNRSDSAGEVRIEAFDETDWTYEPLTVMIGSGEALHLDSDELEQGNRRKGLPAGTGAGEGNWRLELTSELDVEVLAYIRNPDGFLTAMHDVAPSAGNTHRVPVFNPGGDRNQESLLRLVNPGDEAIQVTVSGIDGSGDSGVGKVRLTVPAGRSETLAGWELEDGGEGLAGALGDGAGTWRLALTSDGPVVAMSLLRSPAGHLTNLSTAPGRGATNVRYREETLEGVFGDSISPIVQSKCVNCHVAGGVSGNTRLVFVRAGDYKNHLATNLAVFETFLGQVDDGADRILNKIQGVGHGGGIQVAAGTDEYADMERFLGLLGEDVGPVSITPDTLFDGVRMAPARNTLRRAAIVFDGRVPTEAEYASIRTGGWASLRAAIRGLMKGPGFQEFLIRGSNDRLLTDRELSRPVIENDGYFPGFDNEFYRLYSKADPTEGYRWENNVHYGAGRAPLALIAHVVQNDLPYTEVLTADYIMANRWAADVYGAETVFENPDDPHEFQPSRITSYYRKCDGYEADFTPGIGLRVVNPGPCRTAWPHAGILNTKAFLKRYPTTATNRNRARSRWAYYHFLGLDIEKSASRTTDPVALSDTNNPTMHNPACTACHTVMDPIAGAFQNYGDVGFYKDQWGGMDSLDGLYREDRGDEIPVEADHSSERQTLVWTLSLERGVGELSVDFTNDYYDEATGDDGILYLDQLRVIGPDGETVETVDFEDVGAPIAPWGPCGAVRADPDGGGAHLALWNGGLECTTWVAVDVPRAGSYRVEVVAWADRFEDNDDWSDWVAKVAVSGNAFREGDTWYRDMRKPGFGGELAPDADKSVQWLANKMIADPRFAEATVKFWWPAIMGVEVAEPPEDEGDIDFEGRLLASNAQTAEVTRLASGFRRGFRNGAPYNLKDLLVEIVLSPWFRAQGGGGDDVRIAALRDAGARRLLTPEELARKTAALTGFEWGRAGRVRGHPHRRDQSLLTDAEDGYRLLYGGIDSDGLTERARDITSVMAGVAASHAVESSCPIVLREWYLLPEDRRRLFAGIDGRSSPVSEFSGTFEVSAESWAERQTIALAGPLTQGSRTAGVTFTNSHSDDIGGRHLHLYSIRVRDEDGGVVMESSLKDLAPPVASWGPCGEARAWNPETEKRDHLFLHSTCSPLEIEIPIPADGSYTIEVVAWADQYGDETAKLSLAIGSDAQTSTGSKAIRSKLVELHDRLLGVEVGPHSPEVEIAYRLFVDVWERKRGTEHPGFLEGGTCDFHADLGFLDGILDDAVIERAVTEHGSAYEDWDYDRVGRYIYDELDAQDPDGVARAWVVTLAYLMMDYRYLYL